MSDGADNTLFHFNMLQAKPEPGFYIMEFAVTPVDDNSGFIAVEEGSVCMGVTKGQARLTRCLLACLIAAIHFIKVIAPITVSDCKVQIKQSESTATDANSYG